MNKEIPRQGTSPATPDPEISPKNTILNNLYMHGEKGGGVVLSPK
jgi:hypothetical protein